VLTLCVSTPALRERLSEFGEADGTQLSLFVFLPFGFRFVTAARLAALSAPPWDGLRMRTVRSVARARERLADATPVARFAFAGAKRACGRGGPAGPGQGPQAVLVTDLAR
jgi:hypothetical protein